MKKILAVAGTRPNFMKIAPLKREFGKHRDKVDFHIVHTGQHFSGNMSDYFWADLDIGEPEHYLGITKGACEIVQIAEIMIGIEKILIQNKYDMLLVVGDVNSTLAGTLVASRMGIPIAHIEAGLRSFRFTMPEEQNRIITDRLSDYLFTHSPDAKINLFREDIDESKIFDVGNIMIDSLIYNRSKWQNSSVLIDMGLSIREYGVITLHRQENVDNKEILHNLLSIIESVCKKIRLLYPIHPRTRKRLEEFDYWIQVEGIDNLIIVPPLGYNDFMKLVENAKFVMTDSGGIQEETTFFEVPCLTLREETERPITVTVGSNKVVGLSHKLVTEEVDKILSGDYKRGKVPELWDGLTAGRIVDIIIS